MKSKIYSPIQPTLNTISTQLWGKIVMVVGTFSSLCTQLVLQLVH